MNDFYLFIEGIYTLHPYAFFLMVSWVFLWTHTAVYTANKEDKQWGWYDSFLLALNLVYLIVLGAISLI